MVIEDTYEPTITALGDGANTDHTIGFEFQDNDHIQVTVQDEGDTPFSREVLNYGTGPGAFTITGGDPGTTVVMGTALDSDQRAIIERVTPDEQSVDYDSANNFPADDHEEQMDRGMMLLQELEWRASHTIKLRENSEGDVPLLEDTQDQGGKILVLNSEEDAIEYGPSLTEFEADVDAAAASATAAAASATAAAASAAIAASSAYTVTGSHSSPSLITAGGGITPSTSTSKEKIYIAGSGGAVDISANPQIAAHTVDGAEMLLSGCDDTNTVTLETGTGLVTNGPFVMKDGSQIKFNWDDDQALWVEEYRNAIE